MTLWSLIEKPGSQKPYNLHYKKVNQTNTDKRHLASNLYSYLITK